MIKKTDKMVQYNHTTGLFTNKDRTIAFKSYEDANRYNKSLGGTPGDTPFQDTLKNIRKPLKDGSKGVQYKDSIQRAEEMRKERLNKAWGLTKPKVRQETSLERIERIGYEHSGDATLKKPAHMNNPNIVTYENWGQRPKPFKHEDKSTYPSDLDQRQKMNTWDMLVESAKRDPKDENSKDTKRMLMKQYYNKDQRGYMNDSELKLIGKHKSQLEKAKPIINISSFEPLLRPVPTPTPTPKPEVSIDEVIRERAGIEPGISKDLLQLNADIDKNVKYVLGEDQKENLESRIKDKTKEEEETYD